MPEYPSACCGVVYLADMDIKPLVSINIPTYDSEKTLDECLNSVKNQTYKEIETIIIDSYSTDRTLEIAKKFGARILTAESLAAARKPGEEERKGKYIFLLDSAQILEPNVIEECVRVCEEDSYDVVTLFERSIIHKNTFVERVIAYDKWLFHSQHDDHPIYGSAIPRFFRASYLQRVDYLNNPPITFEHSIIHHEVVKMGARVKFVEAYINHYETPTFSAVAKKFYRYGYYYLPAWQKNRRLVAAHSLPRRAYFSLKALDKPNLFLGLFILYIIKGFATSIGIMRYLLMNHKSDRGIKAMSNRIR